MSLFSVTFSSLGSAQEREAVLQKKIGEAGKDSGEEELLHY